MTPLISIAMALGLVAVTPQALHPQMTMTSTAGQTAEQMAADQSACATQAAAHTGYHPAQPVPTEPDQRMTGQRPAGAARGAAVDGIREQRAHAEERAFEDATEAGARAGSGGVRQRQERGESSREAAQQQQAEAQMESAYSEAFKACLTAKGYVVQ